MLTEEFVNLANVVQVGVPLSRSLLVATTFRIRFWLCRGFSHHRAPVQPERNSVLPTAQSALRDGEGQSGLHSLTGAQNMPMLKRMS